MIALRLCAIAFGVAGVSCGPSAIDGGFDSPAPVARIHAIEHLASHPDQADQAAIAQLVGELQSDDPAVRMMAIGMLERLTGETFGYRHFDSPRERQLAIDRWVQAVRSDTLKLKATPASSLPAGSPRSQAARQSGSTPLPTHREGRHG